MRVFSLCAVLVCSQVAAQQIHRCGNTFSQMPCGPDAVTFDSKPASGRTVPNKPTSSSGATEAQRLEAIVSNSQRDRRRQDLRDKWLPEAEVALTNHRSACERQQTELAASQYMYRQNLYGKTHAAQIASEMAAVSARCDTKDRELQRQVDALAKECDVLKCR